MKVSENRKVISSINVTSTNIKCPGCGTSIGVNFDPNSTALACPFCGLAISLPTPKSGAVAEELDFNTALQRASMDWGRYKKLIICSNCGGQTVYDSEQVTGACPFCGSTSVAPAAETDQVMVPNAVIPFAFSKEQTQDLFINFVKRKRLLNKKALNCRLENVVGIYLPFWTYDAYTASTYDALRNNGINQNSDHVTGNWYQYIDDVVIFASDRLRHPFISKVQNYEFDKAVPYSPEYLAGIPAERYTLGLNEGWERAKPLIERKLKKDIHRYNRNLWVQDEVSPGAGISCQIQIRQEDFPRGHQRTDGPDILRCAYKDQKDNSTGHNRRVFGRCHRDALHPDIFRKDLTVSVSDQETVFRSS